MKPFPLLAVAALGVLLSACFTSEAPRFPFSSAVAAFGNGGRYRVYEHASGKYYHQGPLVVKRLTDGSYEFGTDKDPLQISFHDIGNGVIVGQARNMSPDDKRQPYGYSILTQKGLELFLHAPQCDKQDPTMLAAYRVVLLAENECSVDGVKESAKLFAAISAGEPTFKFVPE